MCLPTSGCKDHWLGSVANRHAIVLCASMYKNWINPTAQLGKLFSYWTYSWRHRLANPRRIQASLCEGPLIPMTTELPASLKIQKLTERIEKASKNKWPAEVKKWFQTTLLDKVRVDLGG